MIREFMFLLPRSPKMTMFRILWRSHNLHAIESNEKLFHELYNRNGQKWVPPDNAFDAKSFYS
jgi:hypothetical protein